MVEDEEEEEVGEAVVGDAVVGVSVVPVASSAKSFNSEFDLSCSLLDDNASNRRNSLKTFCEEVENTDAGVLPLE